MVHKLSRRPNKKAILLETAANLVGRYGFESLTIDALAEAAGVTKGGVQYHFHSKDHLITELLEFLLSSFDGQLPETAGPAWLAAYVDALLIEDDGNAAVAAILAALPQGDPRTRPYEVYAGKWRQQAAGSLGDPALGQIVRLAADGLWLERSFGAVSQRELAAVVMRLRALVAGHLS